MRDQIVVPLSPEDRDALRRVVDVATSYLDEGRGGEDRVPFAERLVRLGRTIGDDGIVVVRDDLHALHRALHVAVGHAGDAVVRGPDDRAAFIRRLSGLRRAALDAVWDHDEVPAVERNYG